MEYFVIKLHLKEQVYKHKSVSQSTAKSGAGNCELNNRLQRKLLKSKIDILTYSVRHSKFEKKLRLDKILTEIRTFLITCNTKKYHGMRMCKG